MSDTSVTLIICITCLLITGIIAYAITLEDIYETPYEQCLEVCDGYASTQIECSKICTQEFSDALENLVDKAIPLIETYLNKECGN